MTMKTENYDVVVLGGAFSGSSASLLLKRWMPNSRILVVEQSEEFGFKVGEATVEISSFFLHRVLGLHDLLAREHLPKHGLRFWFSKTTGSRLDEMTEIGPSEVPRVPAFQLDRSRLDQSLIDLAVDEGVELQRPAKVESVDLGHPESTVKISSAEGERIVTCRWVLDATGRHAFLGRRLRLRERIEEHPTAAVWSRWTGVKDLDGVAVLGDDPEKTRLPALAPSRRLATNHFCGKGWWIWMIPLRGGETSIGMVYDKRHFSFPEGVSAKEAFEGFVRCQSGLRELLDGAEILENDLHALSHLAYRSKQYMGDGWSLLGDAASFIDPFYSPGLDHAAITIYATARIVRQDLIARSEARVDFDLESLVNEHNLLFDRSIPRWLSAIYQDKYELLGDAELTGAAFLLDTSLYYMGVVTPIHDDIENLRIPVFAEPILPTRIAWSLMRFYSHRLVRIARKRERRGDYGRHNEGLKTVFRTAGVGPFGGLSMLRGGLILWIKAELSVLLPRRRSKGQSASEAADVL